MRQTSRLRPVPSLLGELLLLVNALPPRTPDWPDWAEIRSVARDTSSDDWASSTFGKVFSSDACSRFREVFALTQPMPAWNASFPSLTDYANLKVVAWTENDTLAIVASEIRRARGVLDTLASWSPPIEGDLFPIWKEHPSPEPVYMTREGNLLFTSSFLRSALQNVDTKRIRKCVICASLFWAGRSDQLSCSAKCAGVQRTRRWREKSREYEIARALKPIQKPKARPRAKTEKGDGDGKTRRSSRHLPKGPSKR